MKSISIYLLTAFTISSSYANSPMQVGEPCSFCESTNSNFVIPPQDTLTDLWSDPNSNFIVEQDIGTVTFSIEIEQANAFGTCVFQEGRTPEGDLRLFCGKPSSPCKPQVDAEVVLDFDSHSDFTTTEWTVLSGGTVCGATLTNPIQTASGDATVTIASGNAAVNCGQKCDFELIITVKGERRPTIFSDVPAGVKFDDSTGRKNVKSELQCDECGSEYIPEDR